MNRRTFLASLPTLLGSGCAARLGLVDRLEVVEKYVSAVEPADNDGDGRERELVRRRHRADTAPTYDGEIDDRLAADLDETSPLVVSASTAEDLEREFRTVRYGIEACTVTDGERRCRDVRLFLDDFNEIEVGDVVDLRTSDDGAGLVAVHRRRDDRD